MKFFLFLALTNFLLMNGIVRADKGNAVLEFVDDEGAFMRLVKPAQRVVALSPHITENLYAIGAEKSIIAAVEYSDFPEAAKKLLRVGRFNTFDVERIVSLNPDLVIAWGSGNGAKIISTLRGLGIPVYVDEPATPKDVARSLRQYGKLVDKSEDANAVADAFEYGISKLREKYGNRAPVKVFYQIWHDPIQTVNNDHVISRIIELCGGVNVFSDAVALAPTINLETVLQRNPQVIVGSGEDEQAPAWLNEWRSWPSIEAVSRGRIYSVDPDIIQRHTPRILLGASVMCEYIDEGRK